MLPVPELASALVGAASSSTVKDVMYHAPTADEKNVTAVIAQEVGRLEAKLSVLLAHIEGHYESQLANAKLKIRAIRYYRPTLICGTLFSGTLGFAAGHFFR